jgi:hypothetical protein
MRLVTCGIHYSWLSSDNVTRLGARAACWVNVVDEFGALATHVHAVRIRTQLRPLGLVKVPGSAAR